MGSFFQMGGIPLNPADSHQALRNVTVRKAIRNDRIGPGQNPRNVNKLLGFRIVFPHPPDGIPSDPYIRFRRY
ncbi:hypothetical protein D3C81_2155320 [compost metagenome]